MVDPLLTSLAAQGAVGAIKLFSAWYRNAYGNSSNNDQFNSYVNDNLGLKREVYTDKDGKRHVRTGHLTDEKSLKRSKMVTELINNSLEGLTNIGRKSHNQLHQYQNIINNLSFPDNDELVQDLKRARIANIEDKTDTFRKVNQQLQDERFNKTAGNLLNMLGQSGHFNSSGGNQLLADLYERNQRLNIEGAYKANEYVNRLKNQDIDLQNKYKHRYYTDIRELQRLDGSDLETQRFMANESRRANRQDPKTSYLSDALDVAAGVGSKMLGSRERKLDRQEREREYDEREARRMERKRNWY